MFQNQENQEPVDYGQVLNNMMSIFNQQVQRQNGSMPNVNISQNQDSFPNKYQNHPMQAPPNFMPMQNMNPMSHPNQSQFSQFSNEFMQASQFNHPNHPQDAWNQQQVYESQFVDKQNLNTQYNPQNAYMPPNGFNPQNQYNPQYHYETPKHPNSKQNQDFVLPYKSELVNNKANVQNQSVTLPHDQNFIPNYENPHNDQMPMDAYAQPNMMSHQRRNFNERDSQHLPFGQNQNTSQHMMQNPQFQPMNPNDNFSQILESNYQSQNPRYSSNRKDDQHDQSYSNEKQAIQKKHVFDEIPIKSAGNKRFEELLEQQLQEENEKPQETKQVEKKSFLKRKSQRTVSTSKKPSETFNVNQESDNKSPVKPKAKSQSICDIKKIKEAPQIESKQELPQEQKKEEPTKAPFKFLQRGGGKNCLNQEKGNQNNSFIQKSNNSTVIQKEPKEKKKPLEDESFDYETIKVHDDFEQDYNPDQFNGFDDQECWDEPNQKKNNYFDEPEDEEVEEKSSKLVDQLFNKKQNKPKKSLATEPFQMVDLSHEQEQAIVKKHVDLKIQELENEINKFKQENQKLKTQKRKYDDQLKELNQQQFLDSGEMLLRKRNKKNTQSQRALNKMK